MMKNGRITKIGNLCEEYKHTFSVNEAIDFVNYLDTGNLTENRINSVKFFERPFDDLPTRARKKVKSGCILFSLVRPEQNHFGIMYENRIPDNFVVSTGFSVLEANDGVDPGYLYYLITMPKNIHKLQRIAEQSVTSYPSINTFDILNLDVHYQEDIREQRKISTLLRRIDNKIELNNKINDNLSNQLEIIYNYWFHQFDFPNSNGRPYRSSNGTFVHDGKLKCDIPISWKCLNISDIALLTWGQCPDGKNILNKNSYGPNLLDYCSGAGDMNDGFLVDPQAKTDNSKRLAHDGDILISVAGKIGNICYVNHTISLGRAAMAYTAKNKEETPFVYMTLKSLNKKMATISSGSIQKVINSDHINDFNFAYDVNIVKKFGHIANPIFESLINLNQQNRTLKKIREYLLPVLMNGQVTISD